jgi:hypothetical protein
LQKCPLDCLGGTQVARARRSRKNKNSVEHRYLVK